MEILILYVHTLILVVKSVLAHHYSLTEHVVLFVPNLYMGI